MSHTTRITFLHCSRNHNCERCSVQNCNYGNGNVRNYSFWTDSLWNDSESSFCRKNHTDFRSDHGDFYSSHNENYVYWTNCQYYASQQRNWFSGQPVWSPFPTATIQHPEMTRRSIPAVTHHSLPGRLIWPQHALHLKDLVHTLSVSCQRRLSNTKLKIPTNMSGTTSATSRSIKFPMEGTF